MMLVQSPRQNHFSRFLGSGEDMMQPFPMSRTQIMQEDNNNNEQYEMSSYRPKYE